MPTLLLLCLGAPALAQSLAVADITPDGGCGAFIFPYTLTGADNSARVVELRQAIACANANATDDLIDLGGNTVVFDDNDASSAEDALPNILGDLTLRNGELQRAPASALQFRFIYVDDGAHLSVQSVTFRHGRMAGIGGAIYSTGSLDVIDSAFIDNGTLTDTAFGGAIFSGSVDGIRISDSTFHGNAADKGGAVHIFDGVNEIRNSYFEQNRAASQGGAVFMDSNVPVRVIASRFTGNQADTGGALAYVDGMLVANSRFENNTAINGGALASITTQPSFPDRIENSLFVGNSASNGVVFHAVAGHASFHNVTAVGNAPVGGAVLFAANPTTHSVHIRNSILWDNPGAAVGNTFIERSIVQGGFAGGTHIIDLDPRLVDAANGDYTLASASPAIDAGDNAFVPLDTFDVDEDANTAEDAPDLAGNPRRHDDLNMADSGAGVAPIADLGAFERLLDSASTGITINPASGLITTESGGAATFTVVLDREPTADVTLPLSSNDTTEGTVAPPSLTFTTANWNVAQIATVTGVDDAEADGDIAYSIVTGPAASADTNYNGIDPADVSVTNIDNDVGGAQMLALKSVIQPGTLTQPAIYDITLSNIGNGDQADDPGSDELIDALPAELVLRSATATNGVVSMDLPANTVHWNGALIASGAAVTIRIEADVAITTPATISNQAHLNYDSDGDGNNDATGLSTDPSVSGTNMPTVFRYEGTAPSALHTPIPVNNPLALFCLLLLIMLSAGAVMSHHRDIR